MFLKKNKKVLIYCFAFLFLNSCQGKNEEHYNNGFTANAELKRKEWFDYIDSVYTYSIKNEGYIDSISLYYMQVNTPSVIATSKYIFWKDSKPMKDGVFNLFIPTSNTQFLIVSNGRRNLILNEVEVNTLTIKESKKVLLDLNNDGLLKDPCNQISDIEKKVVKPVGADLQSVTLQT